MQGFLVGLSTVAAARGLAVDCHKTKLVGPAGCDKDEKRALNRTGSSRFITERNQSTQALPW
jgi:hypothetical protein